MTQSLWLSLSLWWLSS